MTDVSENRRTHPRGRRALALGLGVALLATAAVAAERALATGDGGAEVGAELDFETRSLDGTANHADDPALGSAGLVYPRVTDAAYADDAGAPVDGPDARYISNRIFNDTAQNLFSENGVTQWAWTWGQFLDHTFGLRESGTEEASIAFDVADPMEKFTNDLGVIAFERSAAADGTGLDSPREQTNTLSSYIDAFSVYGGDEARLEWLREGPVNGDLGDDEASLLLTEDDYLPRADSRGDAAGAPEMELVGRLRTAPDDAVVAGDVRANENLALTGVHTLFAREHNRIVDALPDELSEEQKFDIARRVVGAEQQWITYEQWLPALGIELDTYDGYDPDVDPSITNEFATVGYRAHSMIHGEFEIETDADTFPDGALAALEARGVETVVDGDEVELAIPLNVAFANPDLLEQLGLGPVLVGLAGEPQYNNDEQIDDQLRSVLFQIPGPDVEDPSVCLDGEELPDCFTGVNDLGAIDIERARDHGMPTYNDLRVAYGLDPAESFTDITGEETEDFPDDPALDADDPIDDPAALDVVALFDADGEEIPLDSDEAEGEAVRAERRTTVAARLRAIYGSVDDLDAFVGMSAEEHVPGTEFGELQLAMWTEQFSALRDGDRFFYGNDPALAEIADRYGIDYRVSLPELIAVNTDLAADEVPDEVFVVDEEPAEQPAEEPAGEDAAEEPSNEPDGRRRTRGDGDRRERREGEPSVSPGDRPRPRGPRPQARSRT